APPPGRPHSEGRRHPHQQRPPGRPDHRQRIACEVPVGRNQKDPRHQRWNGSVDVEQMKLVLSAECRVLSEDSILSTQNSALSTELRKSWQKANPKAAKSTRHRRK